MMFHEAALPHINAMLPHDETFVYGLVGRSTHLLYESRRIIVSTHRVHLFRPELTSWLRPGRHWQLLGSSPLGHPLKYRKTPLWYHLRIGDQEAKIGWFQSDQLNEAISATRRFADA